MLINKFLKVINKSKECSVSEQKRIIDSMPEPRDDFDRVYFNYKCNSKTKKVYFNCFLDLIGMLLIPLFLLVYVVNLIRIKIDMISNHGFKTCEALIISAGNRAGKKYSIKGKIPNQIYKEYSSVKILEVDVFPKLFEGVFTINAFKIWWKFFSRHVFNGFLNIRCLVNIMALNYLILEYFPKAIVVSRAELNNISSVNSFFCEENGINYINFMHGELLKNFQTSFVRFSEFYVWDTHYQKILEWGRCPSEQFVFYLPDIFKCTIAENNRNKKQKKAFITYYMSGTNTFAEDVDDIIRILTSFVVKGKCVRIRPHPRWSDIHKIFSLCEGNGVIVEDHKTITVEDSLQTTEYVVGFYSTVLLQAFFAGIPVIIDDVTNTDAFEELLVKSDYILLKKNHYLLSDFISSKC